jgi:hypothetical protein
MLFAAAIAALFPLKHFAFNLRHILQP